MAVAETETFRLDTALYIGIGVDVFLAIIAGVLIYRWRKKRKERQDRSREVDDLYGVSQRTERETIRMDSRSASRVGVHDSRSHSVYSYGNTKPVYSAQTSGSSFVNYTDQGSSNHRNSEAMRGSFTNFAMDDEPEDYHHSPLRNEKVVQNPLVRSVPSADTDHAGDMSVTTYYTYKPPKKQLTSESSEITSQGEKSPLSSPPPAEFIDLKDVELRPPASLPSPRPPHSDNEYNLPDDLSVENDTVSTKSSRTLNFVEESVSKLYTTQMDESTQIM